MWGRHIATLVIMLTACIGTSAKAQSPAATGAKKFEVVETTIADIQSAIRARQLTASELVGMYLARIKAFNGTCVSEPQGILGPVTPIPHAGSINALMTLNLRPASRKAWGFDDRKARSVTDRFDDDPKMPDALEVAAALDAHFARTGQLIGPLHGVVLSIKDLLDTYDMRTTGGGDADYANDRPPRDATLVKRLRDAGAIILAKANLGEYASGSRSAFGGTMCNPYDTARDVGGSSGGSASSVAANLVTCTISEEGGPSIRMPSRFNNGVGLSQSQGLVSRDGMIGGGGLNDRNGAACRTVEDVARILDVIAGYDPADDLTVYSVGRIPKDGYTQFARERSLLGIRIGVVREFMDKRLFTAADHQSIDIVDRAISDLRKIGATIVDPGEGGALFQGCIDQHIPRNLSAIFIREFPALFPDGVDHVSTLAELYADPSRVPKKLTIRDFGKTGNALGESKYYFDRYLKTRGDANIKNLTDLINKSRYYADTFGRDTRFRDVKAVLQETDKAMTLDLRDRDFARQAIQQTVMQCLAVLNLDAVTYPTGNIPPALIKAPVEPDVNGRSHQAWTLLGTMGFPAITVPAGFTTEVFDRVRDAGASGGTSMVGPVPARLPVGIDFLDMPFGEATLFRIASAYEAATHHRTPPPEFGSLRQAQ
ncbi:MAG TPA: amidase family protein [Xanthobacteraceae bacterium]|nr:amidase family protein [Xanthobacteraceae bacterium]